MFSFQLTLLKLIQNCVLKFLQILELVIEVFDFKRNVIEVQFQEAFLFLELILKGADFFPLSAILSLQTFDLTVKHARLLFHFLYDFLSLLHPLLYLILILQELLLLDSKELIEPIELFPNLPLPLMQLFNVFFQLSEHLVICGFL